MVPTFASPVLPSAFSLTPTLCPASRRTCCRSRRCAPTPHACAGGPAAEPLSLTIPASMSDEWAFACHRLSRAVSDTTFAAADAALSAADGDELAALGALSGAAAAAARPPRQTGEGGRVSALREAELRRTATGSAKDFFKGFVDVEGRHVDSGYVDVDADAMGKAVRAVQGWLGRTAE